jgi:hypothetical protein
MNFRALAPSLLVVALAGSGCSGRVLDLGGNAGSGAAGTTGASSGSGAGSSSGGGAGGGSGGPHAGIAGGSAYLTVTSDADAAGAGAFTASVVFTSDFTSPDSERTLGACVVRPTYIEPIDDNSGVVGAPRPSMGSATISGASLSLVLLPGSGGLYPPQKGPTPAWTGGEVFTFAFSDAPADVSKTALKAPQYVTLSASSALATNPATLPRTSDLTLTWTSDRPPAADDRVLVDLRAPSGSYSTRVLCTFDASAKQGVVSADALQALGAGAGTYAVLSSHALPLVSGDWHMNYVLASHARTAAGLATGAVTFE